MNRTLLLIVTIIISYHCQGQNIGIGAKWIYRQSTFSPPSDEERTILEIVSDTLIDNQQFFILDGTCACSSDRPLILRWDDNQIFQFTDSDIRLLYDFNLNTEIIDGLKYQHITIDNYEYQHTDWFGPFIEDIGSIGLCMTPQANLCEISTGGLCSFISANQDTIIFPDTFRCVPPSSIDELSEGLIVIMPNPTSDSWNITNASNFVKY